MTEQPTTEQPYTDATVRLVVDAVNATALRDWDTWPTIAAQDDALARAALDALAAAGRLLPEGASTRGMCGAHAPTLFGAGLDLQVCELLAGHSGWHGRPNGPGQPWMNWTDHMVVESEVRPVPINEESTDA